MTSKCPKCLREELDTVVETEDVHILHVGGRYFFTRMKYAGPVDTDPLNVLKVPVATVQMWEEVRNVDNLVQEQLSEALRARREQAVKK
jgi:hypothetical protein